MFTDKNESGYTLIEVLVSLTLVLVLLFLINNIMPVMIFQGSYGSKMLAISASKNLLEKTILEKEFKDLSIDLNHNLILKQSVSKKDHYIHIKISVTNRDKKRNLFTLQAYILPDL